MYYVLDDLHYSPKKNPKFFNRIWDLNIWNLIFYFSAFLCTAGAACSVGAFWRS